MQDNHRRFLNYLSKVADIYLVSRLADQRLGFPFEKDFRIFIPDIHLLNKKREETFHYRYECNNYNLLVRVVETFKHFKKEVRANGTKVTLYQLGDFYDMWRAISVYGSIEKGSQKLALAAEQIQEEHFELFELLRGPELNTQFLLGNHDFDLHFLENFVGSQLRYYFPLDLEEGARGVILHGDIFSIIEREIPESVKHLAVHLFSPSVNETNINIDVLRKIIIEMHEKNNYYDYIRNSKPFPIKMMKYDENQQDCFGEDNFNVKTKDDPAATTDDLRFLEDAKKFVQKTNQDMDWDMRMVVLGHTHDPRIAIDDSDGGLFALVDCGAWIEKCSYEIDGDPNKVGMIPSSQIGVLCNNEVCVYQLCPKKD
jgi:UDP-2,3-diacylglucosamine pyrophosphatase LpxH